MNSCENKKLCEITDVIPVRIFPDRAKKLGPIKPMLMSDSLIFSILNTRPTPKHFFAVDPNNKTRKVLLTKDNYNKTTEELFGTTTTATPVVNTEPVSVETEIDPVTEITEESTVETEVVPQNVVEDTIPDQIEEAPIVEPEEAVVDSTDDTPVDTESTTETYVEVDNVDTTDTITVDTIDDVNVAPQMNDPASVPYNKYNKKNKYNKNR